LADRVGLGEPTAHQLSVRREDHPTDGKPRMQVERDVLVDLAAVDRFGAGRRTTVHHRDAAEVRDAARRW
jgi:hypothetical protein